MLFIHSAFNIYFNEFIIRRTACVGIINSMHRKSKQHLKLVDKCLLVDFKSLYAQRTCGTICFACYKMQ